MIDVLWRTLESVRSRFAKKETENAPASSGGVPGQKHAHVGVTEYSSGVRRGSMHIRSPTATGVYNLFFMLQYTIVPS